MPPILSPRRAARRRRARRRSRRPAGDDVEAKQPAFDVAVPKRRAARGPEAEQLREPHVAGEKERGPSGEVALQRVSEPRVERGQRVLVMPTYAVGRIGEQQTRFGGRGPGGGGGRGGGGA